MIVRELGGHAGDFRLILRPNASLSPRQAKLLVGLLGLMMATIGLGFAAVGAWLVLPFSGGELLLLIYALSCSMRWSALREVITIDQDRVVIEKGPDAKYQFIRAWFRVAWQPGPTPKLLVGSHGKWVEVGAFLGEEEKRALAKTLQQARTMEF
ncbi:MAG TPA: DUF2244 domain-containing protein [Methylothermaceae bacterium]|nr:DUF2244 domain-containing protein [Methylothermaceae bacterium]